MKSAFEAVTLVDRSTHMLEVSKTINPELEHVCGDMRDVRLGRLFDAVFIHDAISYMQTRDELRQAFVTAAAHVRPSGMVLVVPDDTVERFTPDTTCGGTDDKRSSRGMRYMEWSYDPDPTDELMTTDYIYALRDQEGAVRTVHDRHVFGLFPRSVWLETLEAVGFTASSQVRQHSEVEGGYELFVGTLTSVGSRHP